jgi:predicted permease
LYHAASPGYLQTLGVPLLRGRHLLPSDKDAVIVSENLARRFWPDEDALGRRIREGPETGPNSRWYTIVGVIPEVKWRGIPANPTADPDIFVPLTDTARNFSVAVRAKRDPASLTAAVRDELRAIDKTIVVFNVATMGERVKRQLALERFAGWLMGAFSGVALLLAAIGIYGVIAYSVSRRTREIGIRIALGAPAREVVGMILRRSARLILAGVAIGIVLALGAARSIGSLLYGVKPHEPAAYILLALFLMAVGLGAAYLPARRATRVDPLVALRHE